MFRITRTIATSTLVSIAISLPIAATTAFADDHGHGRGNDNSGNSSHSSGFVNSNITLTPTQVTAISGARKNYLITVAPVHQTLRTAMLQIQNEVFAAISAPSLALAIAQDSYQFAKDTNTDTVAAKAVRDQAQLAYSSALTNAKVAAQTKTNAAKVSAQTALDKAKSDYQTAITAAFSAGTSIAPSLLAPPRTSFNWMHSNENWNALVNSNGLALGHMKN